ncbi:hypothetical protein HRbin17_00598 [bacterium HR17]|uniref:VWFA domain-containing protein n=1 Tax=Candidatus Fervidibacter japonicus TaxID=2035412 RepID=A0A2H5XA86_9BACT|nr:hypothetical protein HRbin17_00598 [bacterium HR17]
MVQGIVFASWWLALLFALLWVGIAWRRRAVAFAYPTLQLFGTARRDWRQTVAKLLRTGAILAVLLALARPQWVQWESQRLQGVDIVIALDISGSMLASDFYPNRMEAAKQVIRDFVALLRRQRSGDRLGLVVFAAESYTQCPLTDDYDFLLETLAQVQNAREGVVRDGTAIGDGLTVALHRLRDSPAKSKVVVLLSDGVNNAGQIQPRDAAWLAGQLGVRVYTIGIGSANGMVSWHDPLTGRVRYGQPAGFDEQLLRSIADRTNGAYFSARDPQALKAILRYILQLETAPLPTVRRQRQVTELALWCVVIALSCLLLENLLVHAVWRRVP